MKGRNYMKRIFALFLAVLVCFSFAAANADDLSDVKQAGVIRLGVAPEYIPFVLYDNSGNLSGIDVALIDEVARRMGVKVETVNMAFDGLIDSLEIGQVDIIGGAFSKTESRMERIDFTRVYYNGDAQFIVRADVQKPASVDFSSLRDMKIGVQKGTSFDQWIKTNLVGAGYVSVRNVYTYSTAADEMKALERKDVDIVLLDQDVYEGIYRKTGKYQVYYDGFAKENYAFGLRKGSSLTSVVNEHLTDMLKDGTAQKIADRFFKMNYDEAETTIARPSQLPTPTPSVPVVSVPAAAPIQECKNGMAYVSDVTIPDGQRLNQGEGFRKTWRVQNTGTCTWTSDYTFGFVSGDQLSGRTINVPGIVGPGQTVDLSVDMAAPYSNGTFQGNWQMRSPQGYNFGQTIWVKIRVGSSEPSRKDGQYYAPIDIEYFYPDYYAGKAGECVRAYWKAKGASMVEVTVDGISMYRGDVVAPGSLKFCGPVKESGKHYFELHAWNVTADSYSSFTYSTEGQSGDNRPVIKSFYAASDHGHMGDSTTVYWSVSSNTSVVYVYVDGYLIEESYDKNGSASVQATIQNVGVHKIQLVARNVIDDVSKTITYTMYE